MQVLFGGQGPSLLTNKAPALEPDTLGVNSAPLFTGWATQASGFSSLGLSFHICKMDVIVTSSSVVRR